MAGNALTRRNVTGASLAAYALTFQGVKYLWGGTSPETGFDCSGFAQYVYKHFAGIDLPHYTGDQVGMGVDVLGGPYYPGDLLFFHGSSHEGISLGGSAFVHAPHTGDVVKISRLGPGYTPNAARRILSNAQATSGGSVATPTTVKDTGEQGSANWAEWASAFLQKLGVPKSKANLEFVVGWMRAENPGPDYAWNPLATTLRTRQATRSGGVQAYSSESAGLDATVQTIQAGQYGDVRRALAKGSSSQDEWDALRRSPWDAGHYAATPKVPYHASDLINPVVGSKKGSGGVSVSGVAGDVFGLAGVSGLDLAGGAAGAAKGAVVDPVVSGIEGAAGEVGSAIEATAIRVGYILVGLLLGGAALVLVVKTVAPGVMPSPGGGASGAAASAATGTAESAAELAAAA